MNYLAHAYLSFMHDEMMVGNLISDFVKGRKKFDYSPGIQKGIALHRAIDRFTDDHPATREAKIVFKQSVGTYSGAFVDVVYDHFLANGEQNWVDTSLEDFAQHVYQNLARHHDQLPGRLQQMLPYMRSQNWLYNYRLRWGIERSFEGIVRRAVYLDSSVSAYQAFIEQYSALEHLSQSFIPDVKKFAYQHFGELLQE